MARWFVAVVLEWACLCLLVSACANAAKPAGLAEPPERAAEGLPDWLRRALPAQYDGDAAKVAALDVTKQVFAVDGRRGSPMPPEAAADLAWLERFRHLKHLVLSGLDRADDALAHVRRLPELESLSANCYTLTGEGFVHLGKSEKLKDLFILGWRPSEKGLACLTGLENVEVLTVNVYRVPDGWIARLGDMKNLKRLRVGGGFKPTMDNLAGLQALARVQSLDVLLASADDDVLRRLGSIGNLRMLSLHWSSITDAGLAHIEGLPHLENLDLRKTQISDAGLAHVGCITSLKVLRLGMTAISDDGLKHLASLGALEELDLGGTRIHDEGLAHLAGLKHLRDLDLSGTRVTEVGMEHLKGITSLRRLAVWTDYLTDDEMIVTVMDKDRVRKMLGHIEGLCIEFWSRWEDEQFGRWSPKGGAAPVLKPTEVSPDHKVSKWTCE